MNSYKLITLNNGLRYLNVPKKKSKIISLGFIVKVGSRDENKKEYGISHFLEHMLFKTTKKRKTEKLLKDLDSHGALYNAMTTHEYTFYEIHGKAEKWKQLLDILLDLYLNPKLLKRDIDKERGVILEEYNMVQNNLDDQIYEILFDEIYGDFGIGIPIIGTTNNIKKFTRKDITNFRKLFYTFENTAFVSVGNINFNLIKDYIINKTKNIVNNGFYNIRDNYIPIQEMPRVNFTNTEKMGQVNLLFGFVYDGYLIKRQDIETELLSNILTSGSSSILFNLLRTKMGVAYNCSSSSLSFEDSSIFTINCAVDENKVDIVVKKILIELMKLKIKGPTSKDMIRSKRVYENNMIFDENNYSDIIGNYAEQVIKEQDILLEYDLINLPKKITSNKIKKLSNNIFRKDNLNLIVVGYIKEKLKKKIIQILDNWYYKN